MAKSPIIINEKETDLSFPVNVQVSGRTSGGSNYIVRAAKYAYENDVAHVYINISAGEKQDQIAKSVRRQYELLNKVGSTHFTITIVKQDDYIF